MGLEAAIWTGVAVAAAGATAAPIVAHQQKQKAFGRANIVREQQREQQARQEALLASRARGREEGAVPQRRRRLREGFAATLRTRGGGAGLTAPAPLSTPALIAGTKEKLGQ